MTNTREIRRFPVLVYELAELAELADRLTVELHRARREVTSLAARHRAALADDTDAHADAITTGKPQPKPTAPKVADELEAARRNLAAHNTAIKRATGDLVRALQTDGGDTLAERLDESETAARADLDRALAAADDAVAAIASARAHREWLRRIRKHSRIPSGAPIAPTSVSIHGVPSDIAAVLGAVERWAEPLPDPDAPPEYRPAPEGVVTTAENPDPVAATTIAAN